MSYKGITVVLAAVALSAAGLPALAGNLKPAKPEPAVMAPAPAPAPVATTDWTGAYAGLQLGYGQVGSTNGVSDGQGLAYGAQIGYNYDFGKWVLGGEFAYIGDNFGLANAGSLGSVAQLKVRAGVKAGSAGQMMVYGVAGAAQGSGTSNGASFNKTGYVVGAGLDYALSNRMILGGEIDYNGFNAVDPAGTNLGVTTAMARVSFKF